MNHEEEPQPGPLTIEEVASLAKETVLRDGYHVPTVIVEGDTGAMAMQITELGCVACCASELLLVFLAPTAA